jgi:DNA-binding NarL/FixJ family response regulator
VLRGELGFADIGEATHLAEVTAKLSRDPNIGLVVLDSELPGLAGTQGLRQLIMAHPHLQVAVLAARRERRAILEALAAGVHGYIPKDLPAAEMVQAFKTVLDGQVFIPPIFAEGAEQLPPQHMSADGANLLTERQREVLALLAAGKSNKEIARMLQIAESTVKTHLMAAFRLLGVRNRVGAVMTIQRLARSDRHQPADSGLIVQRRRSTDRKPTSEFQFEALLEAC